MAFQTLGLIVGWAIVHRLSKARDIDKERRTLIAEAAESQRGKINALLLESRTYHMAPVRDQEAELKIKMGLQDIAESIGALDRIVSDKSVVTNALNSIKNLRKAITGRHFEDEHTGALGQRDPIIEAIASQALSAKRALLILRHAQYRQHQRTT